MSARPRVLSGMRPAGRLHLGNFLAALDLHRIFSPEPERARLAQGCHTAGIGCLDCKGVLVEHIVPPLEAIRERREHMAARPDHLRGVLREGSARARRVASETLAEVKAAVGVA